MAASGNYCNEGNITNWDDLIANYANQTGIAFVASTSTITDSASGFVSAGFLPGMKILITGSTSNNVNSYEILIVVAGTIILTADADTLTDENAGASVTITSGERQNVIERMEDFVEQITEDYFYAKAFVIYRNGNNGEQLFLQLIPDIIAVTEIKVSGVALSTDWWTYDVDSVYLDPEVATGGSVDAELLLRMAKKVSLFPKGLRNIKLTGTYGKSTCPVAIKQAVIMLCMSENDEALYTKYDDVKSDKLGDATVVRFDRQQYLTGIQEVDRLLKHYKRKKVMMSVS